MLIVVEGCVGAGKSTIAKGLAELRGSEALFEDFESNPFLPSFYEDSVAHAMETEFTFLLLHHHQLKKNVEKIQNKELVADFFIGKDLLYANLNLTEYRSRGIFTELYELCIEQLPIPTLMICLSATTELLIQRIGQRNRDVELSADADYYAKINNAYEKFFAAYAGQKLMIPMDEWDFVRRPKLFEKLSSLVDDKLKHL